MAKNRLPITPAVRFLRSQRIDFKPHIYAYAEHGGAGQAAAELNLPPHRVVKTLVLETADQKVFLMLMHGDQTVSTKQLARAMGKKRVMPADPIKARRITGYPVGGISPFGTRTALPVVVQETILALDRIFINGGKRGFLVEIDPAVLTGELGAMAVSAAIEGK